MVRLFIRRSRATGNGGITLCGLPAAAFLFEQPAGYSEAVLEK